MNTTGTCLAATHIHAGIILPVVAVLIVLCVVYWLRLGRPGVPESRRRIRRMSLGLAIIELVLVGLGTSVIDPDVQARPYVVVWTTAVLLLMLLVIMAILDAVIAVRLHVDELSREVAKDADEIRAVFDQKRSGGGAA